MIQALNRLRQSRPTRGRTASGSAELFARDLSHAHWAYDYAERLATRHPVTHRILIQTSMSPSGPFHVGNFRDTACAWLIQRALTRMRRRSTILLSFDDYDPVRPSQARHDPDLVDCAGLPQGALLERSMSYCQQYLAGLRRLGILPESPASDHRDTPDASWLVHHQHQRYRQGTYVAVQRRLISRAARVAELLGTVPGRLFTVYCEQCQRNTTDLLKLSPREVRYACRSCGALWTTPDLGVVKPVWMLDWSLRVQHEGIDCEPAGQDHCVAGGTMDRTRVLFERFMRRPQPIIVPYGLVRPYGDTRKFSGSRGGGLSLGELLDVMPQPMVLWIFARDDCRSDFRLGLDWSALNRAYAEFDRFTAAARRGERRARALHDLINDLPPSGPLPGWRRVLSAVQASCYDPVEAIHELERAGHPRSPALAVRVGHAHRWLATVGRSRCWISRQSPERPEATLQLQGTRLWTREDYRQSYLALFGTESGPPLNRLIAQFGRDDVVAALKSPDEGRLRARVLANADAALAGDEAGRWMSNSLIR